MRRKYPTKDNQLTRLDVIMTDVATYLDIPSLINLLETFERDEEEDDNNENLTTMIKSVYLKDMMKKMNIQIPIIKLSDLYNGLVNNDYYFSRSDDNNCDKEKERQILTVTKDSHNNLYSKITTIIEKGYLNGNLVYEIQRDEDDIIEEISTFNDIFCQCVEFDDSGTITSYMIFDKLSKTSMKLGGYIHYLCNNNKDDTDDDCDEAGGRDNYDGEGNDDYKLIVKNVDIRDDFFHSSTTYLFGGLDDYDEMLVPNIPKKAKDFRSIIFSCEQLNLFGDGITKEILCEIIQKNPSFQKNIKKVSIDGNIIINVLSLHHDLEEAFFRHELSALQVRNIGCGSDRREALLFARTYKKHHPGCDVECDGISVRR